VPTIAETLADYSLSSAMKADRELASAMRIYAFDTLAVALAGSIAPSSAPVTRTILAACGKAEATVMGVGKVTSSWDAALANGTFAHALELDDDHRVAVLHPGAVVVPAALATAEVENCSGQTFLRALYVGYEVTCRLGEVFRGSQFHHGVHPTALCGVFGAAAAAAAIMDLDRDAFVRALGVAGTQASGLTEWRADGSWIKRLHPGRAAQSGVLAARLAREGFTGPATIFEGEGGFFNAFSFGEPIDPSCMTLGLGQDHHALGTAIKPYPCCRFEHGAIDLALAAKSSGLAADDVAEITIRIYSTGVLTYHPRPKSAVDAQFNVPYAVALCLLRGRIELADFTDHAIHDPDVLALCGRIHVKEDPEFSARYPQDYCVELDIALKDGSRRTLFSDCPSGDPAAARYRDQPGLLSDEVEQKVRSLLTEVGFGERAAALKACVDDLLDAPDLQQLSPLLAKSVAIESQRRRSHA
jgi:2-methylcitrate dehydratase PrpD